VKVNAIKGFGAVLMLLAITVVITAVAAFAAFLNPPPVGVKPDGLAAMSEKQNLVVTDLIEDANLRPGPVIEEPLQVGEGTPSPGDTRVFRSLSDNLLNSLHYYYKLDEDSPPSEFVMKWQAEEGGRRTGTARLIAMEYDISYLLALEIYRSLHPVAIFDEDLEYLRKKVDDIFAEDWHTMQEWPLGIYFDLMELHEFTGEEKYREYAVRYAAGDGPNDNLTPLVKAKNFAYLFQFDAPRQASPVYFYYAAFLADWANRYDETLMTQSDALFAGLMDFLYDPRFKLFYKKVSTTSGGVTSTWNITETYSTLEQIEAVRAILKYYEESGNAEALSLARAVMRGVWDTDSVLLQDTPPEYGENKFFGLYTAYDHGREARRLVPTEVTLNHILLYNALVQLNAATNNEFRNDLEFLSTWLEDVGPLYSPHVNGYYIGYEEGWTLTEEYNWISAKAAIWMARSLVEDELYQYEAQQIIRDDVPDLNSE